MENRENHNLTESVTYSEGIPIKLLPYFSRQRSLERWLPRILLVLILSIAAWVRLYNLHLTQFAYDQVFFINTALDMLQGHGIPLVGSDTHTGGPPHGALSIYLMALPLVFSRDPAAVSGFLALLNLAGVALTYRLACTYFGTRVALLATLLFAVNPWAIYFSRKVWNPDLIIPFSILYMSALFNVIIQERRWHLALAALWLACLIQVHLSGIIFLPLLVGIILVRFRRIRLGPILLGIGLGLLIFAPYLVYEGQKHWSASSFLMTSTRNPWTWDWQAVTYSTFLTTGADFQSIFGDFFFLFVRQNRLAYLLQNVERYVLWIAVVYALLILGAVIWQRVNIWHVAQTFGKDAPSKTCGDQNQIPLATTTSASGHFY